MVENIKNNSQTSTELIR